MYGQYQTNLYPGSASYSYPIFVPKGINGLAPNVLISYNSQSVRGRPSVLGSGWSISKDYIYRDTKGTLDDISDDVYYLVLDGNNYLLVYYNGYYHTEVDYYFKIELISDYWQITKPDGTKYRFGYTSDSKLLSNTGRSYSLTWYLDTVIDTHSNTISYSYLQNPNAEDSGTAYLSQISYGANKVLFSYENTVRPDRRRVYDQGNLLEESRRLTDISILNLNNLISRHHIIYTTLNPSLSSVLSFSQYGSDNSSLLYTINFDYYLSQEGYTKLNLSYVPSPLFSDNSHNDYGVRLEDVNNDGFMDLIKSTNGNQTVWLNNKNNGWTFTSLFSIPENFSVSNVDKGVRFVDVNQDGLTDLLVSRTSYGRKVYINNGTAWNYDSSWNLPVDFVDASGNDLGIQITDINGDGKIDFIQSKAGTRSVYLNTGSGWTSSSWSIPVDFIDSSNRDTGARFLDINGDGLPDILQGLTVGSIKKAWINTGSSFIDDSTTWAPSMYFTTAAYTDNGVRFDDINGDGLIDILEDFFNGSTTVRGAWLNTGRGWFANSTWQTSEAFTSNGYNIGRRLADVNGDGFADIVVSHQDSSQQYTWVKNSSLPYLLKSIKNAYGGITLINYTTSTQYNNTENSISKLGFNFYVVSNVLNNNSMSLDFSVIGLTNYSYAYGKYNYVKSEFRGFGLSSEQTPFAKINHYFYQDDPRRGKEQKTEIYSTTGLLYSSNVKDYNWTISSGIYNVSLLFSTDYLYDGSTNPVIHNTTYAYSHYGLPQQIIDWGDASIIGDEKYYNYTYTFNPNSWIVNKLSLEYMYDSNGIKIKGMKYYYDNLGLNGVDTKGELTKTEQWNSNGQNVFTYYTYDSYGNVVSSIDPLAHVTKYTYDSTHKYLSSEVNALGHVKKYNYDSATGNLLWVESNGIRTSYEYDVYGRILKEILPYDSTILPTKSYVYGTFGTAPITIIVKTKTSANNTDDVNYYYDGLGNLIQIKTPAENNQDIIKNIFYDSWGKVTSEQNPYFYTHSSNISVVSTTANKTYYSYDTLDRVYFVKNSDGTNKTVTFNKYNITDYDENSHKHKYEINTFGQIVKVHEYNDFPIQDEYITSYNYDTLGNLIKITDTKNNIFTFTYDSLGRKTAMSDPDLGNWTYTYDLASNLISQTDARRNITTLTYDELNRVIKKISRDNNITYKYDIQYYGTLANKTENNYTYVYTYDDRYRVITKKTVIEGQNFSFDYIYDSQNRLVFQKELTNLTFSYGKQGLINTISNYLLNAKFNSFGSVQNRTYGNNLVQKYSYDSQNNRLNNIYILNVQNMTYSYDGVGNIITINDAILGKLSTMRYDALDRLIEANVGTDKYRYVFNPIGNVRKIVKNNETKVLSYNGNQVHAPSQITDSLPNSIDLYEPHDLDTQLLNRATEIILRNSNNVSFTNVSLNLSLGNKNINTTFDISANQSIFFFVENNYTNGGDYKINVTVNTNDKQGYNLKFGTYAKSLNLINKDISIATFELLIGNSINNTIRNVTWNCSNGINSFFAQNIAGLQSLFDIMQYNYSTSGSKIFTCNVSSPDGNDAISITFNLDSLRLENYNIMYQNLSKRIVSFEMVNSFYPVKFNLTINTTNNVTKQNLSLGVNERMFAFIEANYSDDILYNVGINLSNSETYDTYNDYFTFDGVDILNYQRFDGNYTNKVITFEVVNNWYTGNVSWKFNNPSINRSVILNNSERLFVFIESNYTTQGLINLRAEANNSKFSDYFVDMFENRPLEMSRFEAIGTNVFEMYAVNHLNKLQNISWSIDNITSQKVTSVNNSIFIFVETNYTQGVNIANAKINSSSYNDTEREVVVI
jgi:YD repeat-containing protein